MAQQHHFHFFGKAPVPPPGAAPRPPLTVISTPSELVPTRSESVHPPPRASLPTQNRAPSRPVRAASEYTDPARRRVQQSEHDRARSRSRHRRRRHHHRRHEDVPEPHARPMSAPAEPRPMQTCSPPARPPYRSALHSVDFYEEGMTPLLWYMFLVLHYHENFLTTEKLHKWPIIPHSKMRNFTDRIVFSRQNSLPVSKILKTEAEEVVRFLLSRFGAADRPFLPVIPIRQKEIVTLAALARAYRSLYPFACGRGIYACCFSPWHGHLRLPGFAATRPHLGSRPSAPKR